MNKIVMCLAGLLFIGGCSYVGNHVSSSYVGCPKGKDSCSMSDENVTGEYKIKKTASGYSVEGSAAMNKSIGEHYERSSFSLILVKDSVVIDEIGMVSGSGDASKAMKFHGTFNKDFDSSIMDYHFMFR